MFVILQIAGYQWVLGHLDLVGWNDDKLNNFIELIVTSL